MCNNVGYKEQVDEINTIIGYAKEMGRNEKVPNILKPSDPDIRELMRLVQNANSENSKIDQFCLRSLHSGSVKIELGQDGKIKSEAKPSFVQSLLKTIDIASQVYINAYCATVLSIIFVPKIGLICLKAWLAAPVLMNVITAISLAILVGAVVYRGASSICYAANYIKKEAEELLAKHHIYKAENKIELQDSNELIDLVTKPQIEKIKEIHKYLHEKHIPERFRNYYRAVA